MLQGLFTTRRRELFRNAYLAARLQLAAFQERRTHAVPDRTFLAV